MLTDDVDNWVDMRNIGSHCCKKQMLGLPLKKVEDMSDPLIHNLYFVCGGERFQCAEIIRLYM